MSKPEKPEKFPNSQINSKINTEKTPKFFKKPLNFREKSPKNLKICRLASLTS